MLHETITTSYSIIFWGLSTLLLFVQLNAKLPFIQMVDHLDYTSPLVQLCRPTAAGSSSSQLRHMIQLDYISRIDPNQLILTELYPHVQQMTMESVKYLN